LQELLFVHNNFPAQFGFLAEALRGAWRCAAIGSETARALSGVPVKRWTAQRGTTPGIFPLAIRAEADLIRGYAAAECALEFRKQGFDPALIIGHPGWGEMLFLRQVFPNARYIAYCEFYYHDQGFDVGFDPESGTPDFEERSRVNGKNLGLATSYLAADQLVAPTAFQASTLPPALRARTAVIHEGVETRRIGPKAGVKVRLRTGKVLDGSMPVITFINRRFEPMRGFHIFMRALPRVLASVPEAEVVLIGADDHSVYGSAAGQNQTWKQRLLAELDGKLDLGRLHFTGWLPHREMLDALAISTAHVYLTYPFVLSWSMLEAMACECLVIGSDTGPVREVITDGENGLLVDFFDPDRLADRIIEACRNPGRFGDLRKAARRTIVRRFDRESVSLPAWKQLIDRVLAGGDAVSIPAVGAAKTAEEPVRGSP
jgi:glycosyltransferase involved in cell wall biosynthesis